MRRHNGLLSSCEPCRRSKLRCDHLVPTCGRCRRTRKAAACVYRPNPTRTASSTTESATVETSPTSEAVHLTQMSVPQPQPIASSPHALRDHYIKIWSHRLALNSTPSFLGLTSFSAVYSENEASLKQYESISPLRLPELNPPGAQNTTFAVDHRQIKLGAELLSLFFDDFALYRRTAIACEKGNNSGFMALPTMVTICNAVEGMYSSIPNHLNSQSWLLVLSRRLFEGTMGQLVTHAEMTLDEYLVALAGRWEAIGLILTLPGKYASRTAVDDPLFHGLAFSATDHKNLGILATAGGDLCLQFCESVGVISDPLGWLLLRHIHLLTLVCGDHDYRPRKRLAELSTLLFAMGYHQLDTSDHIPFFLIEGRKRLIVLAYACDKDLATFLGCPPLIAYRFCRIQLPLDLKPAEIIAKPAIREVAISKLDTKGWNVKESINGVTWSRVAFLLGHVRELVLELSLDCQDPDVLQRADKIVLLSQQVRRDLPSYLQWDDSTETALRMKNTLPIYIHLELLYSNFLLQRILVKRSSTESETLVSLAHQILKGMLTQIAIGQRRGNFCSDLGWTIPYFGLPSAGILSIEVLRQTQNARPWPSERCFSRSEVIQNLSNLVSHIQYIVLPQKGNYEICQQARKVISYILDYVLAAPANANPSIRAVSNVIPSDWLDEEWLNDGTDFIKWIDGSNWYE
ncbi:uncharacterized protein N7498_008903 [Penicillium cinerascens]|uniref:Zn(2)-C6 fungal-type domain-containing protein n=1 Tax=Penicillium cinerascens TaxID=70096 RepID=A0A9W9JIC9_9EURO|nr:uncharacterized protein N7498_008903 [Penicillium cinerascens]KAJ5195465.1 hypothetical protein N7498_008903 [Penicillium cinerascens]